MGLLTLVVMLFTQAAIASATCDFVGTMPARLAAALAHPASDEPCHDQDSGNANLCVAHCQSEDLSLDKPQIKVNALLLPGVAVCVPAEPPRGWVLRSAPEAWADPPPRILLHRFLV